LMARIKRMMNKITSFYLTSCARRRARFCKTLYS